jgi:hypothetical protein
MLTRVKAAQTDFFCSRELPFAASDADFASLTLVPFKAKVAASCISPFVPGKIELTLAVGN